MHIQCIRINNFRRLKDILIEMEPDISIFVGANNSGKTSAGHALDMFVNAAKEKFSIYDFSSYCWAEINALGDDPKKSIEENKGLPSIYADLWFQIESTDLHRVLDLLPGLEWEGTIVGVRIQFQSKNTVETLTRFDEAKTKVSAHTPASAGRLYKPWPKNLIDYLGKRLPQEYEIAYYALDRNKFDDCYNQKAEYEPLLIPNDRGKSLVKSLIRVDYLHAQRHLSDQASNARAEDLSKCLSRFYKRNLEKREEDHEALSALYDSEMQFNEHLSQVFKSTLDRLGELGYPGVLNPHLIIKSALNPTTIMSQDTKVHYSLNKKDDGLTLPDTYNGLGFKNLIYMVIEILDIQARWVDDDEARALLHLIIIEEPEAHLHAQLQQVFIRQILQILKIQGEDANFYNTQLIVTTHSAHILYEKGFKPIRYFRREGLAGTGQYSISLNLSSYYLDEPIRDFLERYLKLTHSDLFFADAVILVEGNVERILLPLMIEKAADSLKSSYLSILEVGGAFAYRFRSLIEFIGIPTLVITDLDSVEKRLSKAKVEEGKEEVDDNDDDDENIHELDEDVKEATATGYSIGKACLPSFNEAITSNQTLRKWLPMKSSISELLSVSNNDLIQKPTATSKSTVYIAYQRLSSIIWDGKAEEIAGRTLEEAFGLENAEWCQEDSRKHIGLKLGKLPSSLPDYALKLHKRVSAKSFNKTSFALGVLSEDPAQWNVPKYIADGLKWLEKEVGSNDKIEEVAEETIAEIISIDSAIKEETVCQD